MNGVRNMSNAEVGVYMKLLCEQWDRGAIPNDMEKLQKMTRARPATLEVVLQKFDLLPSNLRQNRVLEQIRLDQEGLSQGQSKKARKRWESTTAPENGIQSGIIPADAGSMPTEREIERERKNTRESNGAVAPTPAKILTFKSWTEKDFIADIERCKEFYTSEMLRAFYRHWSEPTADRKKMKFQLQKTWDTARRLVTWNERESRYSPSKKIENAEFRPPEATDFAGTLYE